MTPTPAARPPQFRLLQRLLVLMLLTLAAGVGLAGPAAAHNVLISSDPTDGSTLQTAPTSVRLTFDQPVQDFEPVVTIIGPDGQRYESGPPQIDSTVVITSVGALPVAGAYSIAYRIVSADGHPVEGSIAFQLADGAVAASSADATSVSPSSVVATPSSASAAPSSASATVGSSPASSAGPTATSTSSAPAAPAASSSGLSGWVWAVIVLAAVLVIAAIVVILRRPKQPE